MATSVANTHWQCVAIWCSYRKLWVTCVAYLVAVYLILHIHSCCFKDLLQKLHQAIKHTNALWLSPWPLPIRLTGSNLISWKCEPTVTEIAGSVSLNVSSTGYTSICRALWLITNICAITVSQKDKMQIIMNLSTLVKKLKTAIVYTVYWHANCSL